jgi:N6-L-threonylcarbamoyladenine synthase
MRFDDAPGHSGSRDAVLAFDTSNEVIAIGIGRLDAATRTADPVATRELPAHRASNTKLLSAIDALLLEAGIERGQIACVACGRGPGSFTGVRICMATAKGVAMALEVSLYGLSTPDAVAWRLWADGTRGQIAVVADAMRKEVYPVRYALDDAGIERLNADVVMKAADGVPFVGSPDLVTGDGLVKYRNLYEGAAALAPEERWTPTGLGLLLALQASWRAGEVDPFDAVLGNPAFALPVYTRLSDAEENERIRLADTAPRDLKTGVQHDGAHHAVVERPRISYRPLDAAHAADVALGRPHAQERDNAISDARADFDWERQFSFALDPDRAREYRRAALQESHCAEDAASGKYCTMCGPDFCSVRLSNKLKEMNK